MRYKTLLLLASMAAGLLLLGESLQSFFGLDPPYALYFVGYCFKLMGYTLVSAALIILIRKLRRA